MVCLLAKYVKNHWMDFNEIWDSYHWMHIYKWLSFEGNPILDYYIS